MSEWGMVEGGAAVETTTPMCEKFGGVVEEWVVAEEVVAVAVIGVGPEPDLIVFVVTLAGWICDQRMCGLSECSVVDG